jgi:hypothetical protein
MPTLKEMRADHPEYNDLSDQQLADGVYKKFYSDLDRKEFNKRIGYTAPGTAELTDYDPSKRERLARGLLGDKPGDLHKKIVRALVGSEGLGNTTPSAIDFSPVGPILSYDEAERAKDRGDYVESGLDLLGVVPAAGKPTAEGIRYFGKKLAGTETKAAGRVAEKAQQDYAANWPAAYGTMRPEEVSPKMLKDEANRVLPGETPLQGQSMSLLDVGGEATLGEGRRAANISGEAREKLGSMVSDRYEGQTARVLDFLRTAYNDPKQAAVTAQELKDAARASTSAEYDAAYKKGRRGIQTPGLEQIMQSPIMQDVEAEATRRWEAKRVAGNTGGQPAFARQTPAQVAGGADPKRTLAYWDQIKRVLDDKINTAKKDDPELARDLRGIQARLLDALDKRNKNYAAARGIAATTFGAIDAVEAGELVAKSRHTADEVRAVTAKMKPDELMQFQSGFLGEYITQISFEKDRRNLVDKLASSPGERQKLDAVLGHAGSERFQAVLNVEEIMQRSKTAITGNSTSVRQWKDAATDVWQNPTIPGVMAAGAAYATGDIKAALLGALTFGLQRWSARTEERIAVQVADQLLSKDPEVYERGLRSIMGPRQQRLRDYLTSTEGMGFYAGSGIHAAAEHELGPDPVPVSSPEEAQKLPPGTMVKLPDGTVRQRK